MSNEEPSGSGRDRSERPRGERGGARGSEGGRPSQGGAPRGRGASASGRQSSRPTYNKGGFGRSAKPDRGGEGGASGSGYGSRGGSGGYGSRGGSGGYGSRGGSGGYGSRGGSGDGGAPAGRGYAARGGSGESGSSGGRGYAPRGGSSRPQGRDSRPAYDGGRGGSGSRGGYGDQGPRRRDDGPRDRGQGPERDQRGGGGRQGGSRDDRRPSGYSGDRPERRQYSGGKSSSAGGRPERSSYSGGRPERSSYSGGRPERQSSDRAPRGAGRREDGFDGRSRGPARGERQFTDKPRYPRDKPRDDRQFDKPRYPRDDRFGDRREAGSTGRDRQERDAGRGERPERREGGYAPRPRQEAGSDGGFTQRPRPAGGRDGRPPRADRGGAEREPRPPLHPGLAPKANEPATPEGLDLRQLPRGVRAELRSLTAEHAEVVGSHLLMAGQLIDSDPELAYAHAEAARRRAARLPVTREATGETAYAAGHYDVALNEFRALRRMSGTNEYLPAMADCERALGRHQAALRLVKEGLSANPDVSQLVELRLVEAGVRVDTGQADEALRLLRTEIERIGARGPRLARARLRYSYADLLEAGGDAELAERWFTAAAGLDLEGETDAADRAASLQGVTIFFDEDEEEVDEQAEDEQAEVDAVADDSDADDSDADDSDADDSDTDDSDTDDSEHEDVVEHDDAPEDDGAAQDGDEGSPTEEA